MRKILLALIVLLLPSVAMAQGNVTSSGTLVPGHAARWLTTQGVVGDAGGAAGSNKQGSGYLTELGITNTGVPFCINDALTSAQGGYHRACFGANALGGFLISYDAVGGASSLPGQVCFNGSCSTFPPTGNGNILGPNSSIVDDLISFNNTSGTLAKDSGVHFSAVAAGHMVGYPSATWTVDPTSTTAWRYVVPAGWPAFTCVSTDTQCFAEALSYRETVAFNGAIGLSLDLYCPGGNGGFISAGTGVTTGVIRQQSILAHGCAINFDPSITGDTFKIDTMLDGAVFNWDGQIICNNSAPTGGTSCLAIHPTTVPPYEGAPGLGVLNSMIRAGAVVTGHANPTPPYTAQGSVVSFNAASGSIQAMDIYFGEINCTGPGAGAISKNGIELTGATPTTGVLGSTIGVGVWHQCINGLFENATNAINYKWNTWYFGLGFPNNPDGTTGAGYDITGNNEVFNLGAVTSGEGPYKYGFKFEISSSGNELSIGQISGATDTVGWVDAGASNNYRVSGTMIRNGGVIFNSGAQIGAANIASGGVPSLASNCTNGGTASSVLEGSGFASSSSSGTIQFGDGAATACTLNLAVTFPHNAVCSFTYNQAARIIVPTSVSASAVTFKPTKSTDGTDTTFLNGANLFYHCF